MSMTNPGAWAVGVWATTVWGADVWYESGDVVGTDSSAGLAIFILMAAYNWKDS